MRLLIKHGADLVARSSYHSQTPLHYAALCFDTNIIKAITNANPATIGTKRKERQKGEKKDRRRIAKSKESEKFALFYILFNYYYYLQM